MLITLISGQLYYIRLLVFSAFVLLAGVCESQNEEILDSARAACLANDFKKGAELFERGLKDRKSPDFRRNYFLGELFSRGGNRAKGILYLERAIDEGWDNIDIFKNNPHLSVLRTDPSWPELEKRISREYNNRARTYYSGLYFGILCLLLVVNGIFFFATREKSYLFYTMLVLSALHVQMLLGGGRYTHYFTEVLPWMASINQPRFEVYAYATIICYLLFFWSLAQMRKIMPVAHAVMVGLLVLTIVVFVIEYFSKFILAPWNGLLVFGFCAVTAIIGWRKGLRHLRYYVFASSIIVICVLGIIAGVFKDEWMMRAFNPFNVGFILFILILSFAMGDKVRLMRIEKEKAQEKALDVLEQKVQERTAEVVKQKQVLQEKQNEILDSIHYAKRLQEAILPPAEFLNKNLPENFVLYKPKDVVAGDFYWAESQNGRFYIAAADSTGHGVPGAMVSVVCSNALNRAVKEFGLTETGRILDKARELVLETFEKSTSEVQDGMDISLLCIDEKSRSVTWSGANNPLWYTAGGSLKDLKPDKQPVGRVDNARPFRTQIVNANPDTTYYLFTDGFADQFGGPDGKKFKYKQFEQLLLSVSSLPMKDQMRMVQAKFTEWKGHHEQVDDVCVIGIRV
jgi:serine phosphatase RsbU (regulator of sigma subunit)